MSDHRMREFGPVEQDEQGRLSAEHQETGWTIKAPDEPTLHRMAGFVRRAARLRRGSDGL
ncbi:hypothetical protein AB0K60_19820 [Thermopolyspora sp. NPDC052614]|uniref:hypothetical protein n=1 Tax=Thermopolyspora sp. NPDC052614 TaxID=3155682 RepID=UPI00341E17AA